MKPKHYEEVKIIELSGRDIEIKTAWMYLRHARVSRHHPAWHATLMLWIAECRKRAQTVVKLGQQDLFA